MTGASFARLKDSVRANLTAYGEITTDACIRQMCDVIIGHGEPITPYQLTDLMRIAEEIAEHNMQVYDKLIAIAKAERMRMK